MFVKLVYLTSHIPAVTSWLLCLYLDVFGTEMYTHLFIYLFIIIIFLTILLYPTLTYFPVRGLAPGGLSV